MIRVTARVPKSVMSLVMSLARDQRRVIETSKRNHPMIQVDDDVTVTL
jgi:hypothetical protein